MAKKKPAVRKLTIIFWSCALFAGVGYLPTKLLAHPVISMAAAAAAIIPYGARAKGFRQAIFRGVGLGLLAGLGINSAMLRDDRFSRAGVRQMGWIYVVATVAMCVAVAALYAHLAKRRRERIDREWRG